MRRSRGTGLGMKLVTEYLEQAVHFERMAEQEADEELKTKLLDRRTPISSSRRSRHASLGYHLRRGQQSQAK
jgi:hypothetical protein